MTLMTIKFPVQRTDPLISLIDTLNIAKSEHLFNILRNVQGRTHDELST